ncbi:FecR family protein [Mangrovicoccus algicola]|uniref:DUF4880 domain-containing protein n=1 Tax=Mangrovicoccus algicola TaxID=2771008 RepID=A0A8J7CU93_9RHOB|nr:hypothetical protein [Mangrovicoccus algicola]MBE3637199.1 hypothetical protein [Mangrovicoccus algicola]
MSRREDQAARWLLRSAAERQASPEFARWIAQPGNRQVFAQLSVLLEELPREPELAALPLPAPRKLSRRQMLAAGGATAVVATAAALSLPDGTPVLQSGRGARIAADLPAGTLLLDAGSRAELPEGAALRLISGRAEIRCPEPVEAELPGCRLIAQGRVSLHRSGRGGEVSVIGGRCRLQPDAGPQLVLAAGQEALVLPGEMPQVRDSDLAEALAWTEGRAVFEDRPLRAVVEDLNRYRAGHVQLLGGLGAVRVSGSYPTDRPEQGLDGLVAGLSLTRRDVTPWLVLLSA